VAIIRHSGSPEESLNISVDVNSSPGKSSGHIQLVAFRSTGGVLEPVGTPKDVGDGEQAQEKYEGFGKDIHEIYVLMTNTSNMTDDYKVGLSVKVSAEEAVTTGVVHAVP
jgi:hypothetical protein